MEAKKELQISIELIKYFYQELKMECNSIEELTRRGYSWIEEINAKYNSEVITNNIKDVLLTALHAFAVGEGINYTALIMKGGGIKGIAYVGALEELLNHYNFNWYAGTSAGAITAILLGSGYTIEELDNILGEKKFSDFRDANILKAILNLVTKSGLYQAKTFNKWIEELLAVKLDSPFSVEMKDLPFRTTVYASRKDKSVQIFDSHKFDSQNSKAAFAARCSMSIPLFFTPQKIDGRNVLDGGVKNNFPVDLLLEDNKNANFVGLYLGSPTYKHKENSVIHDLYEIWTESNEPEILKKYKENIIIIDPSPISTYDFSLTNVEKEFLLESGRLSALKFLDKNNFVDKNTYDYDKRVVDHEKTRKKIIISRRRKKAIYIDLFFCAIVCGIFLYRFNLVGLITSKIFHFF